MATSCRQGRAVILERSAAYYLQSETLGCTIFAERCCSSRTCKLVRLVAVLAVCPPDI